MKKVLSLFVLTASLFFLSCSKEILQSTNIDGSYYGVFEWTNTNPAVDFVPLKGDVSVTFDGLNYSSTGNGNYVPASSGGKFFIKKDVMTFTDTMMHTANFDWNMLLNGSYTYTISGDNITLTKIVGYNKYVYRLKKQ
jgi:hypothetical protein